VISLVALIGKNRELGKKGDLCWRLKSDMEYYLGATRGKKLLVGKRTFDGMPLYPRGSYVYVLNTELFRPRRKNPTQEAQTEVVTDLRGFVEKYKDSEEEVVVIGGASVYAQVLPFAKKMYLNEVEAEDKAADVFFPELDNGEWDVMTVNAGEENGIRYRQNVYTRK